jgi:hypothetical protein
VPELSRFFGIIIRMFAEVGAQHHVPHFHAYYQDKVGSSASIRWNSLPVPYPGGNNAWLKRGPNYIRMIWWPIGKCWNKEELRARLSR